MQCEQTKFDSGELDEKVAVAKNATTTNTK